MKAEKKARNVNSSLWCVFNRLQVPNVQHKWSCKTTAKKWQQNWDVFFSFDSNNVLLGAFISGCKEHKKLVFKKVIKDSDEALKVTMIEQKGFSYPAQYIRSEWEALCHLLFSDLCNYSLLFSLSDVRVCCTFVCCKTWQVFGLLSCNLPIQYLYSALDRFIHLKVINLFALNLYQCCITSPGSIFSLHISKRGKKKTSNCFWKNLLFHNCQ